MLVAACGGSTSQPAAPTPTPALAISVATMTVTAANPTVSVFQLVAMARFSDGSVRDVTTVAVFESSNTFLATVAPGGVVTVVAGGDVELRATYQNVIGTFQTIVNPPVRTVAALAGVIREIAPNDHPIAGARIDIVSGPDAGKSALSDVGGTYQFRGLALGRLSLTVTFAGYQILRVDNFLLPADTQEDLMLVPLSPHIQNVR